MDGYILTPIGVIVIATYSFLIFLITVILRRFVKRFPWIWRGLKSLAVILLLLPWLEEAWISWHFAQACKDAGVKVYRQVEVEGYVDALNPTPRRSVPPGFWHLDKNSLQSFGRAGYLFIENMLDDGGVLHIERQQSGVLATILDRPSIQYRMVYAYQPTPFRTDEPIGWKLEKLERQVIDSKTGEILGKETDFRRVLPTYEALIAGLFGPPIKLCPKPSIPQPPFPQSILKPKLTGTLFHQPSAEDKE